jgi:hypothetical protein
MTNFEIPASAKNLKVIGLSEAIRNDERFAQFEKPIEKSDLAFLMGNGLQDAVHRAEHCMGWIWRQWLRGTPKGEFSKRIEMFIERGLELRERCQSYDYLPLHDLFLLHCAIFASGDSQLRTVAEKVADASGDKGKKPMDVGSGELYAAAWVGMMKYWILGDDEKAVAQSALIWGAYRETGVRAAAKPLVAPWLKRDWKDFVKAQQKDFEKLWNRARKDHWTIKAENSTEIVVTTDRYQIAHHWCWAHCGMAILAHRQGVEVVNDPFWFPAAALEAGPISAQKEQKDQPDQLRMF